MSTFFLRFYLIVESIGRLVATSVFNIRNLDPPRRNVCYRPCSERIYLLYIPSLRKLYLAAFCTALEVSLDKQRYQYCNLNLAPVARSAPYMLCFYSLDRSVNYHLFVPSCTVSCTTSAVSLEPLAPSNLFRIACRSTIQHSSWRPDNTYSSSQP